jgi:Predicted inhibitor of MCP methylation, homolog of CheC
MDVKLVNPFIDSFTSVMPELGFGSVQIGKLSAKGREIVGSGVLVVVGIVGAVRGNVLYAIDCEAAKKIASTMMCDEVEELDDTALSAISELTNMLTAHAATAFYNIGIEIDISTPTMLQGKDVLINMNSDQVLCIELIADDISVEINISFETNK